MIAAVVFIVLGNPTCCGLLRGRPRRGGVGNSAPPEAATSPAAGRNKEVEIDITALTLEASVSINSDDTCNICFAHRVRTAMQPCGHSYACKTCGNYFLGKPCGICRTVVTKVEITHVDSGGSSEGSGGEESADSDE